MAVLPLALKELDFPIGAEALGAIIDGVAASGTPENVPDWFGLVGPDLSANQQDYLRSALAQRREEMKHGAIAPDPHRTLEDLRGWMRDQGIDYLFLNGGTPGFDEFPPPDQRYLRYLSGFTGDTSYAIIGQSAEDTHFITTRINEIKARNELNKADYQIHAFEKPFHEQIKAVLKGHLSAGKTVAFDPDQFSRAAFWRKNAENPLGRGYARVVEEAGAQVVFTKENPVIQFWANRLPPPPLSAVTLFPESLSGEKPQAVRSRMAKALIEQGADFLVTTSPDIVAHLFGIRGFDAQCAPLKEAAAIVDKDGRGYLYIDPAALTYEVREALAKDVMLNPRSAFEGHLEMFQNPVYLSNVQEALAPGQTGRLRQFFKKITEPKMSIQLTIFADPGELSGRTMEILKGCGDHVRLVEEENPAYADMTPKNAVQQEAIRKAHEVEGLAYTRFLFRLEKAMEAGKDMTEWDAACMLEEERLKDRAYKGPSFPTISSIGKNAADIHREADPDKTDWLEKGRFYLVDAGAHYLDEERGIGGTTDMTRTTIFGDVPDDLRLTYTQVVQSHVRFARQHFADGTTGVELDATAQDCIPGGFPHRRGHPVSQFGFVHGNEKSFISPIDDNILVEGAFFSNEPGYYNEDEDVGIRQENLHFVQRAADGQLCLEAVSLAPMDLRPILDGVLDKADIEWLDTYHAMVRAKLLPLMQDDPELAAWLEKKTEPYAVQRARFAMEMQGGEPDVFDTVPGVH